MAEEETNKVEPVFKGIDETGMDFWYEDNVNKLKYWFYRSGNIGTVTPTDPTNPDGWDEDDYGDNVPTLEGV